LICKNPFNDDIPRTFIHENGDFFAHNDASTDASYLSDRGIQTVDHRIQSVHDAIYIKNDTDMASTVLSGSGTADTPYIAGGYEIDAYDEGPALYIGNTPAQFILRNSTLFDSTSYSSLDTKAHPIRAASCHL